MGWPCSIQVLCDYLSGIVCSIDVGSSVCIIRRDHVTLSV
jgi:hypothetical protein